MRVRHRATAGADGRTRSGDAGASAVEYSLAAVGVAGVLTVAVFSFGERLAGVFDCFSGQLGGTVASCGAGADLPPVDPSGPVGGPTTTSSEPAVPTSATTTGGATSTTSTTISTSTTTSTTSTTTSTTTPTTTSATTTAG